MIKNRFAFYDLYYEKLELNFGHYTLLNFYIAPKIYENYKLKEYELRNTINFENMIFSNFIKINNDTILDFPDPLEPTNATTEPDGTVRLKSFNTNFSALIGSTALSEANHAKANNSNRLTDAMYPFKPNAIP